MNILIVDDDPLSRMMLSSVLAGYGFPDPVEADDGCSAWELLQDGLRPALVFSDQQMPGETGLQLLQRLRNDPGLADTSFVLVSAVATEAQAGQARVLGAHATLTKPLPPDALPPVLAELLDRIWSGFADSPRATLQRLAVPAARMVTYLQAYQRQLRQLAGVATPAAANRPTLGTLYQGAIALGLHQIVRGLDGYEGAAVPDHRLRPFLYRAAGDVAAFTIYVRRHLQV